MMMMIIATSHDGDEVAIKIIYIISIQTKIPNLIAIIGIIPKIKRNKAGISDDSENGTTL